MKPKNIIMIALMFLLADSVTAGVSCPLKQVPMVYANGSYVLKAGDTMTGALKINPADGTSDPLFEVETTGVNQYGIEIGTMDLTGIGAGKYAYLIPKTNGAVTNMMLSGPIIIGDSYPAGLGMGQALGFLNETTLVSMLIQAQWNYDGAGNNRISFNDDVYYSQNCEVAGTLSVGNLNPTTLTIGDGTATTTTIIFNDTNYDGDLNFYDSGGGGSVKYYFGNAGLTGYGASSCLLELPGTRLQAYNRGYNYIDLADGKDHRMYYSGYVVDTENSGATAHYFTATGTELPADGWFMQGYHMSNPGHIFGFSSFGDLYIGSSETSYNHNTYLKFRGKNNNATITFNQTGDRLIFEDDITLKDGEGIILGNYSGKSCSGSNEGELMYNKTSHKAIYCNSTNWILT